MGRLLRSTLASLVVAITACTGGSGEGGAAATSGGGGSSSGATSTTSSTAGGGGASTTAGAGGAGGASTTAGAGGTGGASTTAGAGGAGGASTTAGAGGAGGGITGTRVRVVAANLTSGNLQSYDPGPGIRILEGVHPDVVLMQEMNYGADTESDVRALVDAACGVTCDFMRGAGDIPNGVLSRYPILESGEWPDPSVANRDFVWARIDVPGPTDLWAVSVHLLTSSETDRATEATTLVDLLDQHVNAGDYVVVGGDFNTKVRSEPAIAAFAARLSTAAPYPADGNGNDDTSGPRTRPYDWVLASPELRARETPVVIGADSFAAGLVVDTRVYDPIADLAPALASDSGAPNMQHMAVVRDFLLE